MKKIYLTFLIAAFASATWAQDTPKKPSFTGFVSNGFWDNWEISVGAGAGTAFSNGSNLKSFGDRIGFEGNFSLTKWVHPVVGLRAQLQGGWFNNYDPEKGKMDWPYMFVHTDVMLNVSNWIGGYREDRAWYAVPFVGFGYMAMDFTDRAHDLGYGTNQELAFTAGLLNKFRIAKGWDLDIELKGMLFGEKDLPRLVEQRRRLCRSLQCDGGFSRTASTTATGSVRCRRSIRTPTSQPTRPLSQRSKVRWPQPATTRSRWQTSWPQPTRHCRMRRARRRSSSTEHVPHSSRSTAPHCRSVTRSCSIS